MPISPQPSALPTDLQQLRLVGSSAGSIDGRVVAVVEQAAGAGGYTRRLWDFSPGNVPAPLRTSHVDGAETAPAFAPDGRHLAFIADREDGPHVVVLSADDRSPRSLHKAQGSIREITWLGPEQILAVVDPPIGSIESGDVNRISWLRYKADGRNTHSWPASELWLIPFAGGSPTMLLAPHGRVGAVAAAKGSIAYVVYPLRSDYADDRCQLRLLDRASGKDTLAWACPAPIEAVAAWPERDEIVALSSGKGDEGVYQRRLWLVQPSAEPREIFPGFDASIEYAVVGDAHATSAPKRVAAVPGTDILVAVATVGDDAVLVEGRVNERSPQRITPVRHSVTDFSVAANARIMVSLEQPTCPSELYVGLAGRASRSREDDVGFARLSALNAPWATTAGVVGPETVKLHGTDGLDLRGLLYCPPTAGPHPLLVRVHGGPHLCWGSAFDLEAQVEVAAGFAVLLPNLRGSAGRGAHFRSLSVGEWGRSDFDDLMAFVDHAASLPRIDEGRLYLAGGSYGGYLTNWTLTKTNRFRAAISERSVSNLISKYGTSDNGFSTNRTEMGGADLFDETITLLLRQSPLFRADLITTPLLLLHGEDDKRCPIEQSEQMFTALKRLNRNVVMIRFPGESHELTSRGRPDHRIQRIEAILDWWRQHS